MARARLHIHPLGLALIFFGLLSWVVALGGLAASTKYCEDQRPKDDPSLCARSFQLEWWSIWFEFFLLLIMLLTCFTNVFERARFIYLSYLTLATVLLTITARNFITNSFSGSKYGIDWGNKKSDANNAVAAGAVLLCITNYSLIVFVGLGASAMVTNASTAGYTSAAYGANSAPMAGGMESSAPVTMDKYQPSNF